MSGRQPQPIRPGFFRRAELTLVVVGAAAVVIFAVIMARQLSEQASRTAEQKAALCAMWLAGGDDGEFADRMPGLLAEYEELIAVGVVETGGNLTTFGPPLPALITSMQSRSSAGKPSVRVRLELGEQQLRAWLVHLPPPDSSRDRVEHVAFVLRDHSQTPLLLWTTGIFGLCVWVPAQISMHGLRRWFKCQVSDPLLNLVQHCGRRSAPGQSNGRPGSNGFGERKTVAEQFAFLREELDRTLERAERAHRSSQALIREHESRFDLQLRRARDQATLDPLTRLRNRRFLDEELGPMFDRHRAGGQHLSLVMLDLDNFKQLNDGKGHQAGDEVLRFVGTLLNASIRPQDFGIRYGGDEFALLLMETTSREAGVVAERIVKLFAQYTASLGLPARVTLSAGVASTADHPKCSTVKDLLAKADAALYRAKKAGKNSVAGARGS